MLPVQRSDNKGSRDVDYAAMIIVDRRLGIILHSVNVYKYYVSIKLKLFRNIKYIGLCIVLISLLRIFFV